MSKTYVEKMEKVDHSLIKPVAACGSGFHIWLPKEFLDAFELLSGDLVYLKVYGIKREKREHIEEPQK